LCGRDGSDRLNGVFVRRSHEAARLLSINLGSGAGAADRDMPQAGREATCGRPGEAWTRTRGGAGHFLRKQKRTELDGGWPPPGGRQYIDPVRSSIAAELSLPCYSQNRGMGGFPSASIPTNVEVDILVRLIGTRLIEGTIGGFLTILVWLVITYRPRPSTSKPRRHRRAKQ
jgi:hypothetical protein